MKNTTNKFDINEMVTKRIIEQLEQGVIPWRKPWSVKPAISHLTGKPYSLLNQMILDRPGEFLTFKQVQEAGGKVKKGAKASPVTFWKMYEKTETDPETGEEVKKTIPILKHYNVFHIDDCEGVSPKYTKEDNTLVTPQLQPDAEAIISNYRKHNIGLELELMKSNSAYYIPDQDKIVCPITTQFKSMSEFYSTLFHEMTHSTGHKSRLDRKLDGMAAFGSAEYSKEELIAEMGAAALVNISGLENSESFGNSAAYIQSWLKALQNDKRMIVSAASKAEKAVNYILEGLEPSQEPEPEEKPRRVPDFVNNAVSICRNRVKGSFDTLVSDENGAPTIKHVNGYINQIAQVGYYKVTYSNSVVKWHAIDLATGVSFLHYPENTLKEAIKAAAKCFSLLEDFRSGKKGNYTEMVNRFAALQA